MTRSLTRRSEQTDGKAVLYMWKVSANEFMTKIRVNEQKIRGSLFDTSVRLMLI